MFISEARLAKKYTIGGKANGLFRLQSLGYRVPSFIVLPFEYINVSSLSECDNFQLSSSAQRQLHDFMVHCKSNNAGVAVRSSVGDEDGMNKAFSGIMKSYMNLHHFDDVVKAIVECIKSAFSESAIQYRKAHQLTLSIKPALIVQQQIDSDVSGIMFTTNPQFPQELAIHSVYGQGEGIVSGRLVADEYYFYKHNAQLCRKIIPEKEEVLLLSESGLLSKKLNDELKSSETLLNKDLIELVSIANTIEKQFACPQDIEFAIYDSQIWILQSRAITQKIEPLVILDNSNIQESYSGVVSPLTFSFAQRAYATVYLQTMRSLQLPESTVNKHIDTVENLLGLYKGRIYYNINNWYKGLQLLPSFKQNKADMEKMMGLQEPVDFVHDVEKTWLEKIKLIPSLLLNLFKLGAAFLRLDKSIHLFLENFTKYHHSFYERLRASEFTLTDLWAEKESLDKKLLNNWSVPIINDFYVMMQNGKVNRILKKKGIPNVESFLSAYKVGDNSIASLRQGIALEVLAEKMKNEHQLKQTILENRENAHEFIRTNYPSLYKDIEHFIHEYGDRTIAELKLETITMRVNSDIFYKYLAIYLDEHQPKITNNTNNEAVPTYLQKLLKAIKNREELRLKRTHLFGMYRSIYLAIAQKLYDEQKINNIRDIFYLREEEIEDIVKQQKIVDGIKLVEQRKKEEFENAQIQVPDRVYLPEPPSLDVNNVIEQSDLLKGEGCAGPKIIGEVIVVDNVNDDLNVKGRIIVAKRTDPGWISLFPSSAGVIIERGSSLSHSVILLREMNKPSIINVKNLLTYLHTGDTIEMNPSTGEIKILNYAKNTV